MLIWIKCFNISIFYIDKRILKFIINKDYLENNY